MNMKESSVSRIRWMIKEFELDIRPIRARLVNKVNNSQSRLAGILSATEHIPKSVQKTDSGLSAVRESIRTLNTR